ncbi:uncharacterized protein EI90DRAFT_3027013 [Cantharellus anzutake]|uniref:uncharacterized protein n=1 Tax=Cantharellus anzutake TaxID=1750568 RepID=UPI001902F984|nr:uncharacterized protein EI90DRAFT_3027013 [Cantharellus anzutake]KAF8305042.1 hypothetical protein EI90DRAFT_3027013 [Cantharellus anzutake]
MNALISFRFLFLIRFVRNLVFVFIVRDDGDVRGFAKLQQQLHDTLVAHNSQTWGISVQQQCKQHVSNGRRRRQRGYTAHGGGWAATLGMAAVMWGTGNNSGGSNNGCTLSTRSAHNLPPLLKALVGPKCSASAVMEQMEYRYHTENMGIGATVNPIQAVAVARGQHAEVIANLKHPNC